MPGRDVTGRGVTGRTDRASRLVAAPADRIYAALVSPHAIMAWLPPDGMAGQVLEFDPQVGGAWRFELTYERAGAGKTTSASDVTSGRFLSLVPGREVAQTVRFDARDPAFAGEMTLRWSLAPVAGGTQVTVTASDVPAGILAEDHVKGLGSSLDNLAVFVTGGR